MSWQVWESWSDEWELEERVSFNGYEKRIVVNSGVTSIELDKHVYSAWARWMTREDNSRFSQAIRFSGYDPIPNGFTGVTFFMTNGWKFCYNPNEVAVKGAMFSDNFDTAYWNVDGIKPIYPAQVSSLVNSAVSYQNVVTGTALTPEQTRDAVWAATNLNNYGAGSAGQRLESVGASSNPWDTNISAYTTPGTAGNALRVASTDAPIIKAQTDTLEASVTVIRDDLSTIKSYTDTLETSATQLAGYVDTLESSVSAIKSVTDTMPTAANIADAVRTELTTELTHISTLQNGQGLDSNQAIMLLELFRLSGLDPSLPLVVTKTSRIAGGIQQTISGDSSHTTVTRL